MRRLDAADVDEFESLFRAAGVALGVCDATGREVGTTVLFGDFTRRAIAAGFERTRFVDWLGPAEILEGPPGRIRGRVLYYNNAKGRGKLLGGDRVVYFVGFSAIRGSGYRSLRGGQLVEFAPMYGVINERLGWMAQDLAELSEIDGSERGTSGR
jgi:cold shock CspA family protein